MPPLVQCLHLDHRQFPVVFHCDGLRGGLVAADQLLRPARTKDELKLFAILQGIQDLPVARGCLHLHMHRALDFELVVRRRAQH
eukprot:1922674-Rhodomonas_salina.6